MIRAKRAAVSWTVARRWLTGTRGSFFLEGGANLRVSTAAMVVVLVELVLLSVTLKMHWIALEVAKSRAVIDEAFAAEYSFASMAALERFENRRRSCADGSKQMV